MSTRRSATFAALRLGATLLAAACGSHAVEPNPPDQGQTDTGWTGTLTYAFSGDTSWTDAVTGATFSQAWDGDASIKLKASTDEITTAGGVLSATSIQANQTYDYLDHTEEHASGGCVTTTDNAIHELGNLSEPSPPHQADGSVAISFDGSTYTLGFSKLVVALTGDRVTTVKRQGCGQSDGTTQMLVTNSMSGIIPPTAVTRDIDSTNPKTLSGSVEFRDGSEPWKRVKLTWDLRRP